MSIVPLKPRRLVYAITGLVIAVVAVVAVLIALGPALSSSNLSFMLIAVILSAIMLYKLSLSVSHHPSNDSVDDIDKKNIRLALNFQGQGKLDAAFALLKQCKPSAKVTHLLTNLAQDYEIINQPENVKNVCSHILVIAPDNIFAQRKIPEKVEKPPAKPRKITPISQSALFNNQYEIIKNIGKGTDSTIFVAKDHANEKQLIALKILEINYDEKNALETELLARFMREAETAASLEHENIVQVIDSGQANDVAYIVMEFVRGRSLRDYSQPNTLLPHTLIIELIAQCADGLQYAHEKGIIHRDVKPANIFYDHTAARAKLGDFGIAHIANSTQTLAGSFLGTPFYMSPEQLSGSELDARSDIFSLGATMYRLLTGVPPFTGDSMARLMHKIVHEKQRNMLEIMPNLPTALVDVIEIALAKDPQQRFSSASEFAIRLRQCSHIDEQLKTIHN